MKFGENLPRFTWEISKFQKSELGKFIPNFPLKHVITSTNVTSISNLLGLSSIEYAMAYMLMEML